MRTESPDVENSMFFHLQYIHLFKAFLKYTPETSPLPTHVSPWRMCSVNAGAISKLMRLYKKMYDLRQICNIAVYMEQTACTIHILHLPAGGTAKRDIIHGVKHLEEIAEDWLCARRALSTLSVLARKWKIELPEEAALVLQRTDEKYGTVNISDVPSPNRSVPSAATSPQSPHTNGKDQYNTPPNQYSNPAARPMELDMPTTAMSPDTISSLAGLGPDLQNIQDQARQITQPITKTTSVGDPLPTMGSWTVSPATRSMPSYPQSFASIHAQASMGPPSSSSRPARQATTSSPYAIDGQEWYLRDGVTWQQNFQTWGLGTAANQQSNARGSNNTSNGMTDPSMFVFRGVGVDVDSGFESLGMDILDHLPGLD
jgi:hypothetical protein